MNKLSGIFIYPVKSLLGFEADAWPVRPEGLAYDRKWMLLDENGKFLTQRKIPMMCRLQARIEKGKLIISDLRGEQADLIEPADYNQSESLQKVTVWSDDTVGFEVSKEADEWFSNALEIKCKLVRQPDGAERIHQRFESKKLVSFADSQPFLIVGTASLDELNSRIDSKVRMNRFRPNLVIETQKPYEEDSWTKFNIGDLPIQKTKLCARCKVVNIEQETGDESLKILNVLSDYRKENGEVNFGIRAKCSQLPNEIQVKKGDLLSF
ncbi:MAG: MOSC domain-containing protein [Saprospiraceae bacterium]